MRNRPTKPFTISSVRLLYRQAIQNCAEASVTRENSLRGKKTDHAPPTMLRNESKSDYNKSTVPRAVLSYESCGGVRISRYSDMSFALNRHRASCSTDFRSQSVTWATSGMRRQSSLNALT